VRRRFEGTVSPSRVKTFRLRTFFASGARTRKRSTTSLFPVASPSPPRSFSFTRRRIPTRP
jgi:hypothetical protein